MKTLRIIIASVITCALVQCAAFNVQTPYGNASSDGKAVNLILPKK